MKSIKMFFVALLISILFAGCCYPVISDIENAVNQLPNFDKVIFYAISRIDVFYEQDNNIKIQ